MIINVNLEGKTRNYITLTVTCVRLSYCSRQMAPFECMDFLSYTYSLST